MMPPSSTRGVAYGIATATRTGNQNLSFKFEVSLTADEYTSLKGALNPLLRLGVRDMYTLVERNYEQLDRLADFYVQLFGRVPAVLRTVLPRDAANGIVESSINWLNATRLFLDHENTWLAREYGKKSPELSEFQEACSAAFDSCRAYRFLYKLRNYTTHCGLPLSQVSLRKPQPEEREKGLTQLICFTLDRDALLSNFDWGALVTRDLRALPDKFELLPLIHEAMPYFGSIMESILRIDIREAVRAVGVFEPYVMRLREFSDPSFLLRITPDGGISPTPVPIDSLTKVMRVDPAGDVLAPFRAVPGNTSVQPRTISAHYEQRLGRGTTVLGAWLRENGASNEFHRIANALIQEDGGVEPVITGLTVVGANALLMAASAMGTRPEAILHLLGSYPAHGE
ncbi:hypothetical protein OG735_20120 [Streptomyces sp. NBC_01210]|uniref:hypothetical protein n=1 Tax=Streptomyces sp. NBC_01210 TaxID=2903774 RepID=UPI002E14CDC4|nr:hypothetical protein OG735_20120 [Streptomyces sp. NBC_01210]